MVDPERADELQNVRVLHELGDRFHAEASRELHQGLDDDLVRAVLEAVADEFAVDLEEVR